MAEAANALPLQKAQGVVSELAQDRTGGTGTGQSRGAGGFGGVGQAGGKGWDGGPIGNGQVGEQHGAGQLGSTDGNPEWLAPRTAAAFLLRTAAAQQVPPVSRTRVAVVLGSVAQPAMGLGPAAQTQSVVPGLARTSSGLFAGTAESAWPAVTAV